MVVNDDTGAVAVRYKQTVPHVVTVARDGKKYSYAFIVAYNICMAWVAIEDLDAVLAARRRNCNCGNSSTRSPEYILADEITVKRFLGEI